MKVQPVLRWLTLCAAVASTADDGRSTPIRGSREPLQVRADRIIE